jgi:hypothetical protein
VSWTALTQRKFVSTWVLTLISLFAQAGIHGLECVLLVDDHESVRLGLRRAFESSDSLVSKPRTRARVRDLGFAPEDIRPN